MSRRLPSLYALRAFEAVVRLGSAKRAAEELSVTPAAISHQLRQLEDGIGQAL
ncbi:MAG: LysR family transcriptional regulator, partial [Luteimonas sp.]